MMTLRANRPRRAKWAAGLAAGLAGVAAWSEIGAQPPGPAPAILPRFEPTPFSNPTAPRRDDVRRTNYPQATSMPSPPNAGPYAPFPLQPQPQFPYQPQYQPQPPFQPQPQPQPQPLTSPVLLPPPGSAMAQPTMPAPPPMASMTPMNLPGTWSGPNAAPQTGPLLPVGWGVSQPGPSTILGPGPISSPGPGLVSMPNTAPFAASPQSPRVLATPQSAMGGAWGGAGAFGGLGGPYAGAPAYGNGNGFSQGAGMGLGGVKRGVSGAGQHLFDSTVGLASASAHAVREKLKDCMFGYPEYFAEPPLGAYRDEIFRVQRSKADIHKFTLYRSDFLAGTDKLSPTGASRLNLLACRINGWLGPVVVEWTPEEPALGEARKAVVLTLLQNAGLPVVPERLVVGPPLTIGLPGVEADVHYNQMLTRYQGASPVFPLPPQQSSSLQQSGGGS